jgi:hypothetical protein
VSVECKRASKIHLGAVQNLLRIFRLFLEFILTFIKLFLFIGMLQNLFLELQVFYLGSSHPKSSLVIFLNFSKLLEYFLWFNYDFRISSNCF